MTAISDLAQSSPSELIRLIRLIRLFFSEPSANGSLTIRGKKGERLQLSGVTGDFNIKVIFL
jgi:hypothetical protein